MRTKVQLRERTADERTALEKLARSRTAETRLVERAQIILAVADGERPSHTPRWRTKRSPRSNWRLGVVRRRSSDTGKL